MLPVKQIENQDSWFILWCTKTPCNSTRSEGHADHPENIRCDELVMVRCQINAMDEESKV